MKHDFGPAFARTAPAAVLPADASATARLARGDSLRGSAGHRSHAAEAAAAAVLRPIRIAPSIIRMGLGARLCAAVALSAVLIGVTALVI